MKTCCLRLALAILPGLPICSVLASSPLPVPTGCVSPNGNRFNLEPRAGAVVQAAQSVAVLPNRAGAGVDLVVATATDMRAQLASPTLLSADAFYVQRSGQNCAADFEGGLPAISNVIDLFVPFGTPTVVADPARDAFFISDLQFGVGTDDNGVGIYRTTAQNLLSTTACPNGTQFGTAGCWTTGAVANITDLNSFLSSPHLAVDPRATGTGSGNVYLVVTKRLQGLTSAIQLSACSNGLNCGNPVTISANTDTSADFAWVQVRPDGGITVSYRNTVFPGVNPEQIDFVRCTPNGAPAPPSCSAPMLVTTEQNPMLATLIGDVPMQESLYPRHAHRLEADGTTVTTFLTYDRCEAAVIQQAGLGGNFCPKTDVVIARSTDGGTTWSPPANVSNSQGQQFFATIATDTATATVNVAYYSTENDAFAQRPQVFLVQIPAGSTVLGTPKLLTTAAADVQAGSPIKVLNQPQGFGDRIGLAAAGTGTAGRSRAYVTFTWTSVPGIYAAIASPDDNNHLTALGY